MKKRNKTNRDVIIIALFLSLGIGAVAYYSSMPQASESAPSASGDATASDWIAYTSSKYGFSFSYPANWQIDQYDGGEGLPYVLIGNPREGQPAYALKIWVVPLKASLTAQAYVKKLLADDTAIDIEHARKGSLALPVTPVFTDQFALTVGSYPAYELFNVFEFDHSAEQIYVANGNEMLAFDFPVAAANPAVATPAVNNAAAHEIIKTIQLHSY